MKDVNGQCQIYQHITMGISLAKKCSVSNQSIIIVLMLGLGGKGVYFKNMFSNAHEPTSLQAKYNWGEVQLVKYANKDTEIELR